MHRNSYSVHAVKEHLLCLRMEASASDAAEQCSFLPVSLTERPADVFQGADMLTGISLTLPDGTVIGIRRGSASAVVSFLKLLHKGGCIMFGLEDSRKYYVCQRYVRMNLGINGLSRMVSNELKQAVLSGDVFIFFGKRRQMVKLLCWDGDGFLLYQKRLEKGTFEYQMSSTRLRH